LGDKDLRVHNPRFTRAAGHANQTIADAVAQVAERKGIPPRRSPWRGSTAKRRDSAQPCQYLFACTHVCFAGSSCGPG